MAAAKDVMADEVDSDWMMKQKLRDLGHVESWTEIFYFFSLGASECRRPREQSKQF